MTVLAIVGWERYQHYKDRDLVWVKLYRDLLTSESWVLGTDSSRLLQVASMLLAPRYENKIPFRWDLLRKVSHLDMSEKEFKSAVQHLIEQKFFEFQQLTNDEKVVVQPASTALATCTSEKSREEEIRGEERISGTVPQERDDGPVERIFEHWRTEYRKPRAVLDQKRRRVIQAALKAYDEETLCAAVSGFKNSPHHMGENDRRTVYDDIELFLRDSKHVEDGLRFARGPPAPALSAVAAARQKLRESMNGNGRVVSEQSGSGDSSVGQAVGFLR